MREALQAYVNAQSRMLAKWADGSLDLKNQLWRDLHACEEAGRAALEAGDDTAALREVLADIVKADDAALYEMRAVGIDVDPKTIALTERARSVLMAAGIDPDGGA
jgi:hypothetical protein